MAVPGFHAEASVARSTVPHPAGPPVDAGPGALVTPAFTQEELDHINECERQYEACDGGCPVPDDTVPYEQWFACHYPCVQQWSQCIYAPPDSP